MSQRIYVPPRRRRELPIDDYSKSALIAWGVVILFAASCLFWAIASRPG
jgi:hypothetical protein